MDSLFDDQIEDNIDYLTELTKPGAKFDKTKYSNELDMYRAIAKGKWHADKTFDAKIVEFDQLREDYLKVRETSTTKAELDTLALRLEQRLQKNDGIVNTEANIQNQPPIDL